MRLPSRRNRRYLPLTGLIVAGVAYTGFAFAPAFGGRIPPATFAGYTFEGGFLVMALAMVIVGMGIAVVHPTGTR